MAIRLNIGKNKTDIFFTVEVNVHQCLKLNLCYFVEHTITNKTNIHSIKINIHEALLIMLV